VAAPIPTRCGGSGAGTTDLATVMAGTAAGLGFGFFLKFYFIFTIF
jgi:hypothetical protein